MMHEEFIDHLDVDGLVISTGARRKELGSVPAEALSIDDILGSIPNDPLMDPATYGGGVPSFRPVPSED